MLVCAIAAVFAQNSSKGELLGGRLMPANESGSANQHSDCKSRFLSLVKDLDRVLASDPETIGPVFEVFYKNFPVEKCAVEEVLSIARSSRFFTSSEETPAYYNIAFNSARVSSRPGFAVLMSLSKQTGNLELPFAKVNGY
jgi:hypothetical protein